LLPLLLLAAPSGWSQDYGDCLRRAAAEGRPLLVMLERSEGPVRPASAAETVDDPTLLAGYVLCRVDVSTRYGAELARSFHASEFPFTAIIDRTGHRQIYRRSGQIPAGEWKTVLAAHRQGVAPSRSAETLSKLRFEGSGPQIQWQPARSSAACFT
jgi:hypothetical protein